MERVGEVLLQTYRIERLLGEGGMSQVYEARHVRVPKRFAVKFLHGTLKSNPEALQRFRREAEVIAALEHPKSSASSTTTSPTMARRSSCSSWCTARAWARGWSAGRCRCFEAFRIAVAVGSALGAAAPAAHHPPRSEAREHPARTRPARPRCARRAVWASGSSSLRWCCSPAQPRPRSRSRTDRGAKGLTAGGRRIID